MKTKPALIPGFTAYDVTPTNESTVTVPPSVAPTIATAPIPQRLTHATAPRTFTFSNVTSPTASAESDDDDGPPVPPPTTHAPFDMTDTNARLIHAYHVSYATWRHFTILSQVTIVKLHSLHKVMM
jgi:hypothetical protein